LAFNAAIAACFVFVRRFIGLRQYGWAAYSAVTGVVALGFAAWPTQVGISWRLVVAVVVIFAWQITFAAKLRRELGADWHLTTVLTPAGVRTVAALRGGRLLAPRCGDQAMQPPGQPFIAAMIPAPVRGPHRRSRNPG
jgi:hypothetical protein